MWRLCLIMAQEDDRIESLNTIERIKKARALNIKPEKIGLNQYFIAETAADKVKILKHRSDVIKKP